MAPSKLEWQLIFEEKRSRVAQRAINAVFELCSRQDIEDNSKVRQIFNAVMEARWELDDIDDQENEEQRGTD